MKLLLERWNNFLNEEKTYTIQSGDTLGGIASKLPGVSMADIQNANGIKDPGKIWVGQVLKIPPSSIENEYVAATLMGEGGSEHGASMMIKIMTIIVNRSLNTGKSNFDVAKAPLAFSYWIKKDVAAEIAKWSKHSLWDRALEIAKNKEVDTALGDSTYYFIPGPTKFYKERPSWAESTNSCWEEIHNDGHHIYGKAGKPWDNCLPKPKQDF
jgi:LysM repeat protein